ncbi:MAG: hypothetical protein LBU70_10485 [Chitinispirillales bacterium]|jgi:hypothetical protein|nr:hypothetical protein [Chitinispirillales bacterium]
MKRVLTIPIIAAAALLFLCGCSIFDLKDPAPPLVGPVTEDPLNISHILRVVNESAVNMNYRDYFTDDVRFEYPPLQFINGKDNVVNMLNRLRGRTSHVEWQIENAESSGPVGHNMHVINGVPYLVYSGGNVISAGIAFFHISRGLDWRISSWKDVPDAGFVPFFEP